MADIFLFSEMNFFRVCEVIFIVWTLIAMRRLEKKDLKNAQYVWHWVGGGLMVMTAPFAFIDAIAAFGFHFFDVNWAFTPLDVMAWACIVCYSALAKKKLFGIVDTAPSVEE